MFVCERERGRILLHIRIALFFEETIQFQCFPFHTHTHTHTHTHIYIYIYIMIIIEVQVRTKEVLNTS